MWAMILDGIGGLLRTRGLHRDCFMISCRITPFFPMTKPGFSASMITSPRLGSKLIPEICASGGTIPCMILSVSFSGSLTEGSERITIRFLIRLTMSAIT